MSPTTTESSLPVLSKATDRILRKGPLSTKELREMPHPVRLREAFQSDDGIDTVLAKRIMEDADAKPEDMHRINLWLDSPVTRQLVSKAVQEGLDEEAASTVIHQVYHLNCFRIAGSHLFRVTPGLAQRLTATALPKLPTEYLQLPYRSLYLDVPSRADLQLYNIYTGWHTFEGCYVTLTEEDERRVLRVMAVARPNEKSVALMDDALMYFRIDLDKEDLHTCIAYQTQKLEQEGARQEFKDTIPAVFRLITNALLYITSADAVLSSEYLDPERKRLEDRRKNAQGKTRKLEKIREALKKTIPDQIHVMGSGVRVLRPREDGAEGGHRDPTWDPTEGFRVRRGVMGHWKRVHTKEGQKIKWIESYDRGQWVKYGPTDAYEVR